MAHGDPKRQSPDLWQEIRASGIEALRNRVDRYGNAKKRALDVAQYIAQQSHTVGPLAGKLAWKMRACGDFLMFRHYFTVDQVRLHSASFCKKHLLCPLCAIRRGAKAMQAYLPRYEAVLGAQPRLRPFLVTLTVKDGADLDERFRHLQRAQAALWKRRLGTRQSCALDQVKAAVWSYEVKRGSGSGMWHPHLHMVALAEEIPDQAELRRQWHEITGDSFMCDVRAIDQADPASGFLEVFKYALKFSDMTPADTFEAFRRLSGRRLVGSAGAFRGVEIPEALKDEPLDGLPYVDLFYRYLDGGYTFIRRSEAA